MVMISFWANRDQTSCFTRKSPLAFFTYLFKKKKYKIEKSNEVNNQHKEIPKVPKTLSVSVMDMRMTSPYPISPALSTLTLTPGRTRDIDQDMEALRLSRQDNPFLQVLASRESLAESLFESESDDMNLMSQFQEFPNDLDVDPLSLPEIHEHMIRSPPPTNWPKSPYFKVFTFPSLNQNESGNDNQLGNDVKFDKTMSIQHLKDHVEVHSKFLKCNEYIHDNGSYSTIHSTHSPRSSQTQKPHQRSSSECRDRTGNGFPVLRPKPMRSLSDIRRVQVNGTNTRDRPSEESEQKFNTESPITVPLLSKKFS